MLGLMQDHPLLVSSILDFAEKNHPQDEIVSKTHDGSLHRYTYKDCATRTKQLANALKDYGIGQGDRIASLAWNDYRHLELYFAVPGIGSVLHTINPRLSPDNIIFIVNDAQDRLLFIDPDFLPIVANLLSDLPSLEKIIVMGPEETVPKDFPVACTAYDSFISGASDQIEWPTFDENMASGLCYTSGTTGNPKGVLYSHRSTMLHTIGSCTVDSLAFSNADVLLPVVPMFHANAWGMPYAAALTGAKLVFPHRNMDAHSLCEMIKDEGVSFACGVPTIWNNLVHHIEENNLSFEKLQRIGIGGSAPSLKLLEYFEKNMGLSVFHGWGMTETSPLGGSGCLKAKDESLSIDERLQLKIKQGRSVFMVERQILDEDDQPITWDGKTPGRLMVRGPWVAKSYFNQEDKNILDSGWFDTGDVATIDPDGYLKIVDRSKDLIKSGGEWISSVDMENIVLNLPEIMEAAVIAVPDKKWDERPMLIVVKHDNVDITADQIRTHLADHFSKWQIPETIEFTDELPHTATGKVHKLVLREKYVE